MQWIMIVSIECSMEVDVHLLTCLLVALGLASTGWAAPQDYPSRPIIFIAPFAAGSPVDTVGRVVAERMRTSLGQPIIVENVTGAAGSAGAGRVAQAAPDGYTISVGNLSSHVFNGAVYSLQFDVWASFAPIALLGSNPQLLLGRKSLPVNDLGGLIVWLRANTDPATAGTAGTGGVSHVAAVFFQQATNTRLQLVRSRGTNLAQQDLVGGRIDLLFEQAVNAVTNVRAGKVRAFAVTASSRLRSAPDIP